MTATEPRAAHRPSDRAWRSLALGSPVWLFHPDARTIPGYWELSDDQRDALRADYRAHWVEHRIDGETSLSWVVSGRKLPKRCRPAVRIPLVNREEIDAVAGFERRNVYRQEDRPHANLDAKATAIALHAFHETHMNQR